MRNCWIEIEGQCEMWVLEPTTAGTSDSRPQLEVHHESASQVDFQRTEDNHSARRKCQNVKYREHHLD